MYPIFKFGMGAWGQVYFYLKKSRVVNNNQSPDGISKKVPLVDLITLASTLYMTVHWARNPLTNTRVSVAAIVA